MDSAGLKLRGAGEWLIEKHGAKTRRAWRKPHIGLDADTGQVVAAALTGKEVDDGAEVGPLPDQVAGPVASFTGDGAYDQEGVCAAVSGRHHEAATGCARARTGAGRPRWTSPSMRSAACWNRDARSPSVPNDRHALYIWPRKSF